MDHVVVIGAGQAGLSLVAKLRKSGYSGEITMIGEERALPYQRPPLSKKYLLGECSAEQLYLKPAGFYQDHGIELLTGQTVTAIDPERKTVVADGREIRYSDLVLTTGASPNRLPASIGGDLENVYCVRDLADVDRMAPEFVPGESVLIVGGGYIGLEIAAVAAKKGLTVDLIEREERILKRVASRETSDFFRALHAGHGVKIHEGVGLDRLVGEGRASGAELSDGRSIKADFVIIGIGVTPRAELATAAGIKVENGIVTDAYGATSVPHIWAAGDCASFPYRGQHIRLESVPNAIDHAEVIADNIMGADKRYQARPWFWSDQYDIKLQIAGINSGYNRVVSRENGELSKSFWYFKDSELIAVDAMSAPRDYMVGRRLIESGRSPDPSLVSDLSTNIMSL